MRIFHLAFAADWSAAQATGRYTPATRGRTLATEGFIHASRGDQWQQARRRWYADVTEPMVLLVIETDLLSAPVIEEAVPGGTETFPHVYGAIDLPAVVRVIALDPPEPHEATPDVAASRSQGAEPDGAEPVGGATVGGEPVAVESFSRVYLREMFYQLLLACVVMVSVVAGSLLGLALGPGWGAVIGAVTGLVVGLVAARALSGRRARGRDAP